VAAPPASRERSFHVQIEGPVHQVVIDLQERAAPERGTGRIEQKSTAPNFSIARAIASLT